jgi:lipopolysaccharide transport system permease protein
VAEAPVDELVSAALTSRAASGNVRPARPFVSVCIVSAHRPALLGRCLDSLLRQEHGDFELLVGAHDDPSVEEVVASRFARSTPAGLRNALLGRARGEWLVFVDDDVELEPHFLSTLHEVADAHPEADVLGGPNLGPRGSTRFQAVQTAVLASVLGAGPVRHRYGEHPARSDDERAFTLCALAIRRRVMADFDERLVCAEENELLEGLRRRGVGMRYDPQLVAYHERRPRWRSFAAQMHLYGRGRGQLMSRRPATIRPGLLAPSCLVLYVFAAVPLSPLYPAVLAPLVAYALAVAASSLRIASTLRRPGAVAPAAGLTVTVHACYGSGVMQGFLRETGSRLAGLARAAVGRLPLLTALIVRQLRLRSKRSPMGVMWPIVAPVLLLALYVFVFHHVFRVPIHNYAEFLFAGLLPWTFLAQTLGSAVVSLSNEPELIRRTRFPYELLPLANVTAMSVYFLASLGGFVLYLAIAGHLVVALLPALVFPLLSLYLFVAALALVLALIDVYNRDLRQVLANLLTVWFFLVPIVYQQARLGPELHFLQSVDPANVIVGQFRAVLYYGNLSHPSHMAELLALCLATWLICLTVFRRFSPRLPKEV